MRYLLVVLLLACASVGAQNANELPLYGEAQKSPAAIAADQRFIDSAIKAVGSREAAARMATFRGWQQLKQGDMDVAIQSFNQAYMLQPNNAEVYWGLGVALSRQDKFEMSARLFERALMLSPNNARLLTDVGVAHARAAIRSSQDPSEQAMRMQGALLWFDAAQKLEPGYAVIYANRALALYFLGNYSESWINVEIAEDIDSTSVSAKLIANLSNKMPRPISSTATLAPETPRVKTEDILVQADAQQTSLPVPLREPKIVMPKIPQGIPDEPVQQITAQPATQSATQPAVEPPAEATVMQESAAQAPREAQMETVTAPEAESQPINAAPSNTAATTNPSTQAVHEPQVEDAITPKKKMRIISGQAAHPAGPDKRSCLDLTSNEAIMRCVYPRK